VQVAQAIAKQPPSPSIHLWLKGLAPKHASVDDVHAAFCQWLGDNGKQLMRQKLIVIVHQYFFCRLSLACRAQTCVCLVSFRVSLQGRQ
jgi:hypothetical protein